MFGRGRRILNKGVIQVGLWKRCFSFSAQSALDMASKDGELRVFIVAGEVSGDTIASRLMASINKLSPFPTHFAGVGGFMMSKQGLKSIFPMEDISVMGIWELLPHLRKFRARLQQTVNAAMLFQPHVVVTVDSKGFSFRLLKKLRVRYAQQGSVGPPHFHYVAPSFWAWKGGESRLKGLSEIVDHVLCILPFEEEVCQMYGLSATFVGHPILEDVLELNPGHDIVQDGWKVKGNGEEFRRKYGIASGSTVVSLLPGSRLQEVALMFAVFSSAMELLKNSLAELTVVVHVAPNQHVADHINKVVDDWPLPVVLIPGGSPQTKYDAFAASRAALCTSGTVALELQLARLPCIVAYRAHLLTEWFIRYKAKIPFMSLPNILLDSSIIPEALFGACTPSKLAMGLTELIKHEDHRNKQIAAAEKVMELLWSSKQRDEADLTHKDPDSVFPTGTPSMIAAHTVLCSSRST